MIRGDLSHFLIKNEFVETKDFDPRWEDLKTAYEVIRIMNSKVLFLENHLLRFRFSIQQLSENAAPDMQILTKNIQKLIEINGVKEGNIKIVALIEHQQVEFVAFFIPHFYPNENMYKYGVNLGLLYAERENPSAKISNQSTRKKAENMIKSKGLFEVLLINQQNHITEGSRSNVFFIKDQLIITPPSQEVLQGIIRNKVIEIAIENELEIQERFVLLDEISDFESAFLTGTSLHILPIRSILQRKYEVQNPTLSNLHKLLKIKLISQ